VDPTIPGQTLINFRRVAENSSLPFFRSGEMTLLSHEDATFLAEKYKLRCFFDLRSSNELDRFGRPSRLLEAGIDWYHRPMDQITDPFFTIKVPTAQDYGFFYLRMLPSAIERLHQIVHFFLHNPGVVAFGCGGGKDRTAIVAALLLKMLDYDDALIIDDYLLSAKHILSKIDHFISRYKPSDVSEHLYIEQLLPKRESIEILLFHLKKTTDWVSQMDHRIFYLLKKRIKVPC
jgi:hypothetical protein